MMSEDSEYLVTPEEETALSGSSGSISLAPDTDEKRIILAKLFRKIKGQRSGVTTEATDMDDMEDAKRQMDEHLQSIQSQ